MMNSMLQSSLYGHEFVRYKKNNTANERKNFSNNVKINGLSEVPIVIDSVNTNMSELLAGKNAKRFHRNGKEFHFHIDLLIEDIILEIKSRIKSEEIIKLGLENGKILDSKDRLGDIYKKFKNQEDDILYLLVTQETTMYGYIISLLRYIFGENFMK